MYRLHSAYNTVLEKFAWIYLLQQQVWLHLTEDWNFGITGWTSCVVMPMRLLWLIQAVVALLGCSLSFLFGWHCSEEIYSTRIHLTEHEVSNSPVNGIRLWFHSFRVLQPERIELALWISVVATRTPTPLFSWQNETSSFDMYKNAKPYTHRKFVCTKCSDLYILWDIGGYCVRKLLCTYHCWCNCI